MRSTSWLWGREGELPTSHQLSLGRRAPGHSCPTAVFTLKPRSRASVSQSSFSLSRAHCRDLLTGLVRAMAPVSPP